MNNPDSFGGGGGTGFNLSDVDGPLGDPLTLAAEPPVDITSGGVAAPSGDTIIVPVDGELVVDYNFLKALGPTSSTTIVFQGDSSNDFDWSGDGIVDEDFVRFTDPENFTHFYRGDVYSSTSPADVSFFLTFRIDGQTFDDDFPNPDNNSLSGMHYFPDVRQATPVNIIQNTNLGRFEYDGQPFGIREYALPGAGNPDMLAFHVGGEKDFDQVAFYDPNDPFGGDGDYDFVSSYTLEVPNDPTTAADNTFVPVIPYSRMTGIDAVDAISYGTNTIVLNDDAFNAIADPVTYNALPTRRSDIGGDVADTLVFTDEQNWTYNGIVEEASKDFEFINGLGETVIVTLGSTLDRLQNVAYQFAHNSGDTFVNVSATIGDHPDWYWFGATDGDDSYQLPDTQFGNVDFMAGRDTLELTGRTWSNGVYDFDGLFDFRGVGGLFNVEVLSTIDGAGADTIILDKAAVAAITDANNELIVTGDAPDGVTLSDVATDWNWVGKVDGEDDFVGQQFHQFQAFDGSAVLSVFDGLAGIPELRMFGDVGGVSNDLFTLPDLNFSLADGGAGTDFAGFDNGGGPLDFTGRGGLFANMEGFDLSGGVSGATVDPDFVRDATDGNNLLGFIGDAGDAMTFSDNGDWTYAGYVEASGIWPSLNVFTGTASGGKTVTLIVDDDLGVARVDAAATAGNDRFFARDSDIADFDGGAGLDALFLGMGGAEDLTSGGAINAVEIFNAINGAANALTIDADLAINALNRTVYVVGDAADTLTFAPGDAWEFNGNVAVSDTVSLDSYSSTASDGGAVTALSAPHLA